MILNNLKTLKGKDKAIMFLWKLPQLIQSTSSHRSKILIVISRAQSSVPDLLTIKEGHSYKHF